MQDDPQQNLLDEVREQCDMNAKQRKKLRRAERIAARKNSPPSLPAEVPSESGEGSGAPGRPVWLPQGTDYKNLAPEVIQAVDDIVQPAYQQLVLAESSDMKRVLGASLVHLLWLEILDQFDIKREFAATDLLYNLGTSRKSAIENHLRLLDAKLRFGKLMHGLDVFKHKIQSASKPCIPTSPLPLREEPGVRAM